MNKTLVSAAVSTAVSTAVAALFVVAAPVALAQEPPSCAEAQLAFTRAQVELDVAVAADKAAADALAADEALERAERALEDAREAALSGGVPQANQTATDAARLQADRTRIEAIPVAERTVADQQRLDEVNERLPLIQAVLRAETELTAARAAASADADRLADVAAQTDATALAEVRDTARDVADDLCGGVTTTPPTPAPDVNLDCPDFPLADGRTAQQVLDATPGEDPHGLDSDRDRIACEAGEDTAPVPAPPVGGDFDQVGEIPTGIDTGRA